MEWYKINARHLDESELNYELQIRGYSTMGPLDDRRRDLRVVLRDPESDQLVRVTELMMHEDLRKVPRKLKEISDILSQRSDPSCLSRLVHYYQRIRRYQPGTRREQDDTHHLLDLIARIFDEFYGIDLDEEKHSAPIAESTKRAIFPGENNADPALNQTTGFLQVPRSGMDGNSQRDNASPWLMTWSDQEGAVGGHVEESCRSSTEVIPALVENLLNFQNQGPATVADPRQGRSLPTVQFSVPTPSPSPEIVQRSNTVSMAHEIDERQPRGFATIGNPTGGFSSVYPNSEERVVAPNAPVNQNVQSREYIHVSEIATYVQTCFDQLIRQRSSRITSEAQAPDSLINNMANMSLQPNVVAHRVNDPMPMHSTSRGMPTRGCSFPDPTPPLQLSGHASEHRSTPVQRYGVENHMIADRHGAPRNDFHPSANFQNFVGNTSYPPVNPRSSSQLSANGFSRRLPHQQCSIIEKWPKFTGDNNSVPVTDFLRQINILCRSYDITKQELRMHAHLLFRDNAYAWYTTYEEKFTSWEMLECYLKMRYDNPNRDRVIREEMRARRQRPSELFSAYLTEMEMLAQRMMKKMTEAEKFEIIVENMKQSYKRRLALEPIYSIEHLAQMCFKFDALETNLYSGSGQSRPTINHLEYEEVYETEARDIEEEEVSALQARPGKRFSTTNPVSRENTNNKQMICWNCQGVGHMWRECDKRKTTFCHICGLSDTTAYRCPNKHELGKREEIPKND